MTLEVLHNWPRTWLLAVWLCASLLSSICVRGQSPGVYRAKDEKLPQPVAPQPVPFNHAKHAAARISCLDCHETAESRERSGLPDTAKCMLCHETITTEGPDIKKLARLHRESGGVTWVRVYQVPDFVFFSHARHLKAEVECVTCHGPVDRRAVLQKEVSTSMVACMNCHSERGASNECYSCHDLGQ